ncbi:hypothetical protein PVAND_012848 [Polypedilum vanderplanki]|uniref:Uncharacterized protein n=1 Tax=Polypedilum vanderplanki TaxID=319348 RepID=A0A9J6CNY1_POLVA|nr:hypothetical protein PVAND_012848 [Polypedilum vanderplanki]
MTSSQPIVDGDGWLEYGKEIVLAFWGSLSTVVAGYFGWLVRRLRLRLKEYIDFCLGLGIGILDTSLVPYLVRLTDSITQKCDESCEENDIPSNYGSVYAIQQTAVSLAYSIVPFLAGEMVESMGFKTIMRLLGICNFIYGPLLLFITIKHNLNNTSAKQPDLLLKETNPSDYRRFYNSIE